MIYYENGDIIFAMHQFPGYPHHDLMTVKVPEDLQKSDIDQPLLQQMGNFMVANPLFFSKLMLGKIIMYLSHIRPYWSWSHNIAVVLFLWPLYFFCYQALKKGLVTDYLAKVAIVYMLIHTIIVGITWADWDGRFFVPIIPLVIVLGVIGLTDCQKKLIEERN